MGTSNVHDFGPSPHSVISVHDFRFVLPLVIFTFTALQKNWQRTSFILMVMIRRTMNTLTGSLRVILSNSRY